MTVLFGIGFTSPWLLLALLALPALWLLLRAIPPAPKRQMFPAVTLLLGLKDEETLADRTPWWLLLLRMLAVAAVIVGLAGPVLNPERSAGARGPLLVVLDASWAGADDWATTRGQLEAVLQEAGRSARPVALLRLSRPEPLQFQPADGLLRQLPGILPLPWQPTADTLSQARAHVAGSDLAFDTLWFSDGLAYSTQAYSTQAHSTQADVTKTQSEAAAAAREALIAALAAQGALEVVEQPRDIAALLPARFEDGAILIEARRHRSGSNATYALQGMGLDPSGQERVLATAQMTFATDSLEAEARLTLPAELRARISRFVLAETRSAGAVALSDDRLRRREVALITTQAGNEGLALLSPMHYLRKALAPSAELLEGALGDLLPANPDVIVLADVAHLPSGQETALIDWVKAGGLLLRFAGPRLASSDTAREGQEPLMPVRLRIGGRSIGGAMSWGEPKTLAPFAETSPFYKLAVPAEVTVTSQVVAQPDPDLAARVIAELGDGTPLVTRKALGQGQIVLFHVTANAEWSTLPLSGLFVDMLERLAVSSAAKPPQAADLEGTVWQPVEVLDAFGRLRDAGALPGVEGPDLVAAPAGPAVQPGLYTSGARAYARNVLQDQDSLRPAAWPASVPVRVFETSAERPLEALFLTVALLLMALDVAASLWVSGLWSPAKGREAVGVALIGAVGLSVGLPAGSAQAQGAAELAAELRLAHVLTGDNSIDQTAEAGLRGLSDVLRYRTSVEPAAPFGVDLEQDELALFPLLYWPVTAAQPMPSSEAYSRLNTYLANGGLIFFDTRDADLAITGSTSPATRRLQQIALPLDIPPLEMVPRDHVLTRAFYLLQDFPGRHPRGPLWVEAAPADAEQIEGLPFRNLNDGVTPVVIGGNDWAAAWAVDATGSPMYPVGRGYAGERQRELARRFGVNLVMHVLTGNYKSDQVHVPALLDRLGQ